MFRNMTCASVLSPDERGPVANGTGRENMTLMSVSGDGGQDSLPRSPPGGPRDAGTGRGHGRSPAVSCHMAALAAAGKHVRPDLPRDEPENGLLKLARAAYEGAGTFAVSGGRRISPLPVPVTGRAPGVLSDMSVR